ncbi:MAG: hypothetical protein LQ343_002441 [Gyalolechia ehrenbergii]|nr:MAG: hypothetical protein LQ343_002441 [Gyalolechia ehrenbergii]
MKGTNYSTVASVAELPLPAETSLSIVTQPHITLKVLGEAKEAGISCVWLQPATNTFTAPTFVTANDSPCPVNYTFQGKMGSSAAQPMSSFFPETVLPPKLDNNVGAKSYFFQPPTPSAAQTLQRSTILTPSEHVTPSTGRKRSRNQYSFSDSATPCSATSKRWVMPSGYSTPNVASPAPFINTQYRLAGGLDTPTAALATSLDIGGENRSSQGMVLRGSRSKHRGISQEEFFSCTPPALAREANGRPRTLSKHCNEDGWARTFYTIFGAAGKVWDFCRTSAFRGFHAGEGTGYALKPPTDLVAERPLMWHDMDEKDVMSDERGCHNVVEGRFPKEDFIEDYMAQDHSTPPRAAKKIQRSKGEGQLRENWVMVDRSSIASRDGSPVRLSARKIPPSSASGRRPIARAERRSMLSAHRPSLTSHAGSPGMRSDRPASFASSRSPLTSPNRASPVSVDVQRHAARIRRREMEEDANLKRFNQQLKTMIREGKEALRTTVEVEAESDALVDEGYIEGDYFDEQEKG